MTKIKAIFFGVFISLCSLALAQKLFKTSLYYLNTPISFDAIVFEGKIYVSSNQVQSLLSQIEASPKESPTIQASRIFAVKHAIQTHSINVYLAAIGTHSSNMKLPINAVAREFDRICRSGQEATNIVINGIRSEYRVGSKPDIIQQFSCSVTATKDDFLVTVSGNPGDNQIWISLNGQTPYMR